jgi:hypothetical protein
MDIVASLVNFPMNMSPSIEYSSCLWLLINVIFWLFISFVVYYIRLITICGIMSFSEIIILYMMILSLILMASFVVMDHYASIYKSQELVDKHDLEVPWYYYLIMFIAKLFQLKGVIGSICIFVVFNFIFAFFLFVNDSSKFPDPMVDAIQFLDKYHLNFYSLSKLTVSLIILLCAFFGSIDVRFILLCLVPILLHLIGFCISFVIYYFSNKEMSMVLLFNVKADSFSKAFAEIKRNSFKKNALAILRFIVFDAAPLVMLIVALIKIKDMEHIAESVNEYDEIITDLKDTFNNINDIHRSKINEVNHVVKDTKKYNEKDYENILRDYNNNLDKITHAYATGAINYKDALNKMTEEYAKLCSKI